MENLVLNTRGKLLVGTLWFPHAVPYGKLQGSKAPMNRASDTVLMLRRVDATWI